MARPPHSPPQQAPLPKARRQVKLFGTRPYLNPEKKTSKVFFRATGEKFILLRAGDLDIELVSFMS